MEKKSRPGTDRWFRAKLALALVHERLNHRAQAEKILRLVEILHPEPRLRDREVTARFLGSLSPAVQAPVARTARVAMMTREKRHALWNGMPVDEGRGEPAHHALRPSGRAPFHCRPPLPPPLQPAPSQLPSAATLRRVLG